jgi:lysyl-tRNA synthetase class 1
MHWADVLASKLSGKQLVSTGISPSGPIHVGNMREILTGDALFKASVLAGLDARFIYLCDDIDPLRKIYPFLPQSYAEHVGKPLYRIPAPDGDGTYSEHFLKPFVDTLDKVNVRVDIIRTHDLYVSGVFANATDMVIRHKEQVGRILSEVSGRELEENWFPYNPICKGCGRLNGPVVDGYENPYVSYHCSCGYTGKSDIRKDEGKLPWRIEWPAKWFALNVTVEPFGKDHGAPGGSYDTGKRIVEEIFGHPAPVPMIYERILLKGKGAMHSSTGIAIAASEMMKFSPPEILRFLIMRNNPGRHITFDPQIGILNLIDEYEKYERAYFGQDTVADDDFRRVYELSTVSSDINQPETIGYRHLLTLIQIYRKEDELLKALRRNGYQGDSIGKRMKQRIVTLNNWLDVYAPDEIKFRLQPLETKVNLDETQRGVLNEFSRKMDSSPWEPESLHNLIYEIISERKVKPQDGFSAFYRVLINKERGPRLGYFLSNLEREFVRRRIEVSLAS